MEGNNIKEIVAFKSESFVSLYEYLIEVSDKNEYKAFVTEYTAINKRNIQSLFIGKSAILGVKTFHKFQQI